MATKTREPTSPLEVSVAGEDFISRLPDEIITHILSYVPTKSSAATAILSKRWNRVWISVPNLDLGPYDDSTYKSPVKKSQFFDFVDRVLSLNNVVSVRKVHISCYGNDRELARTAAWMTSFCLRDFEEFHVTLPGFLSYSMPDNFFTKSNLVKLTLQDVVLKLPPLVCFPRLKTICFDGVQFPDDDTMKNLTSGCPVLTHLTIIDGFFAMVFTMYIIPSTLNYLRLHLFYSGHDVVIDALKLTDLVVLDVAVVNCVIINVPSLVRVDLDITVKKQVGFEEKLFGLFRKISHVSELVLTSGIMISLEHADLENLPIFKNLTKLKVLLDVDYSSWWLTDLFDCAPNLVTFILQLSHHTHFVCEEERKWFMEAMQSQSVDVIKRMKEITLVMQAPEDVVEAQGVTPSDIEDMLDELQEHVESIDYANDLHAVGGLVPLLGYLKNSHANIRAKAADVVTTVVQNNPRSQQLVMDANGLEPLLSNFTSDPDVTSRTKALGAISSLIRQNKPGVAIFRLANGYAALKDALGSDNVRFQRKALHLLQYLLQENNSDCNVAKELGFPRIMMHLTSSDDSEIREAALRALLELVSDKTGEGKGSLGNEQEKLKQILQEGMKRISLMSPDDLASTMDERLLADSLWSACYNEPSYLRERGLLILPGEDAPPPDVASQHFEPPLRAWAANRTTGNSDEKKEAAPLLLGFGP